MSERQDMTPKQTNTVTLREFVEAKFEAIDKALMTATGVLEARLEHLNELRGNVITKTEYEAKHEALRTEIESLKLSRAELAGKASQTAMITTLLISGIAAALSLVNFLLHWIK